MPLPLQRSIRFKIAAIVAAAITIALLAASLVSGLRDADRRFTSKSGELAGIAAALTATIEAPLARGAHADVHRALRAIGRMREITFARVLAADGREVAAFGSGILVSHGPVAAPPVDRLGIGRLFSLSTVPVEAPVVSGGVPIGKLELIADLSELRTAFLDSMASALLAGLVAACLGFALALWLQRYVSRPIVDLTRAMTRVRQEADFSLSVPRTSADETGELVDAFNAMLREVSVRDHALREHRDRLEATVAARTAELARARDAAEAANSAKSEFLATMSHEIRTPMNGMLAMAELLAASGLEGRRQRFADVIVASGQSLLAIINDILDLSKIEAGRLQLECIPLDPVATADNVVRLFAQKAAGQGLDIAVVAEPGLPARVGGDPVRLEQVLANLVGNALKFTEQGGVTVRIAPVGGVGADGTARIGFFVSDTGIGIAADKLAGIFEAFTQADQSTTREYGGTGIGLTICRQLVAAMQGEIEAASRPGHGSTFSFTISCPVLTAGEAVAGDTGGDCRIGLLLGEGPTRDALAAAIGRAGAVPVMLADGAPDWGLYDGIYCDPQRLAPWLSQAPGHVAIVAVAGSGEAEGAALARQPRVDGVLGWPIAAAEAAETASRIRQGRAALRASLSPQRSAAVHGAASFAGVHVLAADDSPVNREVLGEVLSRLGARMTAVESGAQAVAAVASGDFDLIFMDGSMPQLDGYAAARQIRRHQQNCGRRIPIIALTAHVVGRMADAWREAGMDDCITKPFTLQSIEACLARWLPAHRRPGVPATTAGSSASAALPRPADAGGETAAVPLLDAGVLMDIAGPGGAGGDLVSRVVGLFTAHGAVACQRLAVAASIGDAAAVAAAAHALRSMCRNIGATRLGDALEPIEAEARASGRMPDGEQLAGLARLLAATEAALQRWHDADDGNAGEAGRSKAA